MVVQKKVYTLFFVVLFLGHYSCGERIDTDSSPNILWIMLEDTSPLLGCYGSTLVETPHIDAIARQGVLFQNAIMPAPVCSPSRSSIITGIMSTTLGLHNHHSSRTPESAIYLPDSIQTIPEIFQAAGYFTFNNGKDDYNFSYDRKKLYSQDYFQHPLYGKKGETIDLAGLKAKAPFFGQIQLSGGKEIFSSTFKERVLNPVDRARVELPPYLPDHPTIIEEYANHLDAIQITDAKVGEIIKQLEEHGLLENTIVFFFSDHGMRLTRHKQFLYEGGLRVPLLIADYSNRNKIGKEQTNDALVSGIDIGPSALALAGISIPAYMEGQDIFSTAIQPRQYVISTRDRCDFTIDRIRSVRTKDFKYIRNFMTDRSYTQPTYMDVDQVPFVKLMHQLSEEGQLDSLQQPFFSKERPAEELYSLKDDPFELHNLAKDPAYTAVLREHADILNQWINETNDQGQYPEPQAGLKLMLGIWGAHAVNPEYEPLRTAFPSLAGSQFDLKREKWRKVEN
ncbi:MAG: sulfatase [Saprospiraceae bacterium]|nr:sulfatase [Saprospiraceae bacterium]